MKFGNVSCANSDCEKVLGYFPADVIPKNVEIYCEECKESLGGQKNIHYGSSFDSFLEEEGIKDEVENKVKKKMKRNKAE